MDVTPQDRLKAIETVKELMAMYDGARHAKHQEASDEKDYAKAKLLDNEADGLGVVAEKLAVVLSVVEDAANRRRRPRERVEAG